MLTIKEIIAMRASIGIQEDLIRAECRNYTWRDLAHAGLRIEAIRELRNEANLNLAEAKMTVDAYMDVNKVDAV